MLWLTVKADILLLGGLSDSLSLLRHGIYLEADNSRNFNLRQNVGYQTASGQTHIDTSGTGTHHYR